MPITSFLRYMVVVPREEENFITFKLFLTALSLSFIINCRAHGVKNNNQQGKMASDIDGTITLISKVHKNLIPIYI